MISLTFSAPQPCNARHNFMCRSQGSSAETTEPLCEGRLPQTTLLSNSYEEMKTSRVPLGLTFSHKCACFICVFQVQGLIISQMLRKSVETRDWVNTIEPRNVRAVMKRVVEDTTSIDVQVTLCIILIMFSAFNHLPSITMYKEAVFLNPLCCSLGGTIV